MELESAIQELLSRLEFVSLPGLGSFVKRYEPATISSDGKSFDPPKEYFIFDTTRKFNDDALENYICQVANLDHSKAAKIVEQFVNGIKAKLEKGEQVIFEGIGTIFTAENGNIELRQSESSLSSTYGLGKVDIPFHESAKKKTEPAKPVQKVEVKPPVKKEVTVKQKTTSTSKSKSKVFIPIAAILIAIILVSVFLFVPETRFWTDRTSDNTTETTQVNTETTDEDLLATNDTIASISDTIKQPADSTPTNQQIAKPETQVTTAVTDKKVALYYQEAKQSESKTFFIIAGSFTQEVNAQKLIQDLSAKGYKPILLQNDNMYRVAIYKFTNRDRALRELERLKSQKISDKVWMLTL